MPKDTGTSRARRSNGEGSITELGPRKFRGAIWLPDANGNMRRKYVRGQTRTDISRKFSMLREQAKSGFPDHKSTGEYLSRWVEAVRPEVRAATHREYARHVAQYWTPLLGSVELTKLSLDDVRRGMAALEARGLSRVTVRSARVTLRRALGDAQRDGLITRNVAALTRPPAVERREMRAMTREEVARFTAATADDPDGPLFAVAIASGLRLGELLGLSWDDVDLDDRKMTVRRTLARTYDGGYDFAEPKTKRSRRTVMLPSMAVDALRRQKARQATLRLAAGTAWQDRRNLVFTDDIGRPASPSHVSKSFRVSADRLGLPVRFHDLRHTAATLMLAVGVPLKVVSETLGHASIVVTADVYAHVTPDLKREAADAMDRALGVVS